MSIIDINEYQPQFVIETEGRVSIIPVSVFRDIAYGSKQADVLPDYIVQHIFQYFLDAECDDD